MPTRFNTPVSPRGDAPLALGFGGSAGSEGPIAYTGAAIGSNIARFCGVSTETVRIMLACGASAGIAGIFKAPVGGVLFSLEVLSIALTPHAIIALFASSVTAALTAFLLDGCTTDLVFRNVSALSWQWLPSSLLPPGHLLKKAHGPCGKFPIFLLSLHPIYPNIQHVKRR